MNPKKGKKREKRNVQIGVAHIQASFNNTVQSGQNIFVHYPGLELAAKLGVQMLNQTQLQNIQLFEHIYLAAQTLQRFQHIVHF